MNLLTISDYTQTLFSMLRKFQEFTNGYFLLNLNLLELFQFTWM